MHFCRMSVRKTTGACKTYSALNILTAVIRANSATIRTNESATACLMCALDECRTFSANWKAPIDGNDVDKRSFLDIGGCEVILGCEDTSFERATSSATTRATDV